MKNKLLILLLLFTANFSFGQQISVQNNELKYRITGGTIRTAADKALFQIKIDTLSNRLDNYLVDSVSLSLKANVLNPTFNGIVNMPSTNINTRRVATYTDLQAIVTANNFIGLVYVDTDSTNGNLPSTYTVKNNSFQWNFSF